MTRLFAMAQSNAEHKETLEGYLQGIIESWISENNSLLLKLIARMDERFEQWVMPLVSRQSIVATSFCRLVWISKAPAFAPFQARLWEVYIAQLARLQWPEDTGEDDYYEFINTLTLWTFMRTNKVIPSPTVEKP